MQVYFYVRCNRCDKICMLANQFQDYYAMSQQNLIKFLWSPDESIAISPSTYKNLQLSLAFTCRSRSVRTIKRWRATEHAVRRRCRCSSHALCVREGAGVHRIYRRRVFLWALLNSSCSRKRKVFERTSSHQRLLNLKGHSMTSRACRTREAEATESASPSRQQRPTHQSPSPAAHFSDRNPASTLCACIKRVDERLQFYVDEKSRFNYSSDERGAKLPWKRK